MTARSRRRFPALVLTLALLCGCTSGGAKGGWESSRPSNLGTGWSVSTPLATGQADAVRMLMVVLFGDRMAVAVSIQPSESIDTVFVTFDGGTRIRLAFGGWHLHQPYLPRAKMT